MATAVAAIVRLFHLGAQSLWIDEVFTLRSAGIGERLRGGDLVENVHGPLYSLLLHAWGGVAGTSEWALRAPSALFGVAMVPAMALLAAEWLGPETALLAAWLTALSPFLVWYSQEARNYTLLMLCACLAALALWRLARRWSAGGALTALALTAAGLLSNFSFALLAPAGVRWWLADRATRGRRLAWLAVGCAALLVALWPWLMQAGRIWDFHRLNPANVATGAPLRGSATFHAAGVPFALHAFAVGYTLGPPLRELRASPSAVTLSRHAPELILTGLVFGLLGLLGLRALARRRRLIDALLWMLVPAIAVSYFAAQNFKVFHPRYLAVAAPAFLLTLAAGLADLGPRRRTAALAAIALLWGVSLQHHAFDPHYAKEDYRGAVALVSARAGPGEKVLAVGAEDPIFHYYHGSAPLERFWLGYVSSPERLARKWEETRAGAPGVWVILSRPEDLDPDGRFAKFIARFEPEAFEREGVRIWHCTRSAPDSARSAPKD